MSKSIHPPINRASSWADFRRGSFYAFGNRITMSLPMRILDLVVLVLCLPFYAIAIPLIKFGDWRFLRRLLGSACPHCGARLEGLTTERVNRCGIKLALTKGANVRWDRLPYRRIRCSACQIDICYDQLCRTTACDMSDAFTKNSLASPPAERAGYRPPYSRDDR